MDKLSDVNRCPYGMTVAMVLSNVNFDAVLRSVDLAIRMAIILLSPHI